MFLHTIKTGTKEILYVIRHWSKKDETKQSPSKSYNLLRAQINVICVIGYERKRLKNITFQGFLDSGCTNPSFGRISIAKVTFPLKYNQMTLYKPSIFSCEFGLAKIGIQILHLSLALNISHSTGHPIPIPCARVVALL